MTHAQMVDLAVNWLRRYGCGVVLSEQICLSGETPDAIGWKGRSHSVVVECKLNRADFLADRSKPFRQRPAIGLGCERFYMAPIGLIREEELPAKVALRDAATLIAQWFAIAPQGRARGHSHQQKGQAMSGKPSHKVFVVEDKDVAEGEEPDAFWTRVGSAWPHKDGKGLNLVLSALPINGRLVLKGGYGKI